MYHSFVIHINSMEFCKHLCRCLIRTAFLMENLLLHEVFCRHGWGGRVSAPAQHGIVNGLAKGNMSRLTQGKTLAAWVSEFAWNPAIERWQTHANFIQPRIVQGARWIRWGFYRQRAEPQEKHGVKWPTKNEVMQVPSCVDIEIGTAELEDRSFQQRQSQSENSPHLDSNKNRDELTASARYLPTASPK